MGNPTLTAPRLATDFKIPQTYTKDRSFLTQAGHILKFRINNPANQHQTGGSRTQCQVAGGYESPFPKNRPSNPS